MEKLDLKKKLKQLYEPTAKEISIIDVPAMNFIMIDGKGNPNTAPEYADAVSALYSAAYTLKFDVKKNMGIDYTVMALEGLWWAEDMELFSVERKGDWLWTMMIMQPDFISAEMVDAAIRTAIKKKGSPALEKLRFEPYHEGLSAQIMYFGAYADEAPTIARIHQFIADNGYGLRGKHHEIYLGDPRKTAPEKLRTVIRQPMGKT